MSEIVEQGIAYACDPTIPKDDPANPVRAYCRSACEQVEAHYLARERALRDALVTTMRGCPTCHGKGHTKRTYHDGLMYRSKKDKCRRCSRIRAALAATEHE